ncbi:hypothetical protein UA08_06882 [Talaromyces atroroseus]|uniref:Uncharacterized protein n=1 Tax=Talaromyces atroroseus TaxID=1441469 RepID=A0A225AS23_TALAT|nr:hypothetical protein UA08_06882 [Talaromyces atroroseus]OKL57766.1 hypothetical protein UA08_06882 [Talaromyces atroroseus]
MSCTFAADKVFGPVVAPCRRVFDFTLFFEELFFALLPSSLLLIGAAVRLSVLVQRPVLGTGSLLYFLKLAATTVFAALELVSLIFIGTDYGKTTRLSIPAAVLSFLASLAIAILSHYEHTRSQRPSFLLAFYLCLTVLFRAVMTRTYWSLETYHIIASVALAALLVQIVMVILESGKKRQLENVKKESSEETAGFISRSLFLWLNSLLWTGYRRTLTAPDLQPIAKVLYAPHLSARFASILSIKTAPYFGLPGQTLLCLGRYLLLPVLPRLCVTGFTFAQPFLTTALIQYLSDKSESKDDGYGLIGASFLVYGGIAISNSWYSHLTYKSITMVRGGLVDVVFDKMLRLREEKEIESRTLTLTINDTQRISTSLTFMHEVWAGLLETALATWLLWRQIGPSSLTVLGLALDMDGRYGEENSSHKEDAVLSESHKDDGFRRTDKFYHTRASRQRVYCIEDVPQLISWKCFIILHYVDAVPRSCVWRIYRNNPIFSTESRSLQIIQFLDLDQPFGSSIEAHETTSPKLDLSEPSQDDIAVLVEKADFGWTTKADLHDISLRISKGDHVAITGPVGCGKSLLMKALLGEAECISGTVRIGSARIGYCGQGVWLENATVLQNAFRCASDNEEWRRKVIDACALRELVDAQESSEAIGSGGVRLSGGERQRLALARTIAQKPDIIILDDVFSALDRKTVKHIRERLFGAAGILRLLQITVIETTQDPRWATMATQVYEIDRASSISQYEFGAKEMLFNATEDEAEVKMTIDDVNERPMKIAKPDAQKVPEAASRVTDRTVYRTYFNAIGLGNLFIFVFFGIAFAFCIKFPDIWAQWWSEDNNSSQEVGYWLGIYAMLQTLPLIMLCIWLGHLLLKIVPTSGVGLHRQLLETVLNATFRFVSDTDVGELLNRFNQDLMMIDMSLPLNLFNTVAQLLTSIIQVVLVVVAAVYALSVLPALLIVIYLIQHFYLRTSKQLRQHELQSKASLHTKLMETCSGLVTIRAHQWQSTLKREFHEQLNRSQEPIYLLYAVQRWLQLTLDLVVAGLSVTVAGIAVGIRGQTNLGAIGVAFLNLTTLGQTMAELMTSWTSLEVSLGAIARIETLRKDTPREASVTSSIDIPPHWPESGEIRFEDVGSSYTSFSEKPVWNVDGITLSIHAGEKVAVCGRSGSGKSTLLLTLLSLIETRKGTIIIDGLDTSCVKASLLRSRFHVISQDGYIQGETIRNALDPQGALSDDDIWAILSDCALKQKIESSGGLETALVDVSLSAGETQLFALARTILDAQQQPGGIVLFDEATSRNGTANYAPD